MFPTAFKGLGGEVTSRGGGEGKAVPWEGTHTQNLRVPDDRANLPEGLLSCFLNFDVGVGQHLCELGHNVG